MKILLKEIRKQKKLSLGQVSILTGVKKTTLYDIERGTMPRMDTIEQIAKGLGIGIEDLYESEYKNACQVPK